MMSDDTSVKRSMDLDAARKKLAGAAGARMWRGLDELSQSETFRDAADHEFAKDADRAPEGIERRDVLKLMAASAAMAGLSACTKLPTEKIVPYVRPPEEIVAGKPLFYATSMPLHGVSTGVLVESHMGRPTKIEGNPEHPGSLGGTDAFMQASILNMYDPDRSQNVLYEGHVSSWDDFSAAMGNAAIKATPRGSGIRLLTMTVGSPTLAAQIRKFLARYPEAKWHQYEPCGRDTVREGAKLAFGRPLNVMYRLDQADVIVSLDADFLDSGPGHVRYIREFSSRRNLERGPGSKPNRLYAVEGMPTPTGAMADHRLALRSSEVDAFARTLAAAIGVAVPAGSLPQGTNSDTANGKVPADWIPALARDLQQHRGSSVVIAGEGQPPFVHALAHAMNAALGNIGKTVVFTEPIEAEPVNQIESLRDLVKDLNAGKVSLLIILGGNPVYNAPVDFDFKSALMKAELRVHSALYNDETAELCHWHVPATHYLESWSDGRAFDGTVGIIQPLIAPLYDSHSAHEIIAAFTGDAGKSGYDTLREYWQGQRGGGGKDFEVFWETSLHDGLLAGSALPPVSAPLRSDFVHQAPPLSSPAPNQLEIVFKPDPAIGDGEFSNNGWLQELPKPVTRLTWDNAAMMSPVTAVRLGLTHDDYITLQVGGRELKAGVFLVIAHVDDSVTLHLGYGRARAGSVGNGQGFNAYTLRTSAAPWMMTGLAIRKTGKTYSFASVQHQWVIEDDRRSSDDESVTAFRRDLVQVATLDEFRKNPAFAQVPETQETRELSLYPSYQQDTYAWGMSIDLNRCVGCNACVIACQSENNIAVVGKDQVERGRVMHWLRIDTYFKGGLETPEMYFEPLPCMQCENAPCEYVCPVGATTHSPEGLNDMTYNRCVGTRYCSNNCPYKVRRFNFYLYSDYKTPSLYGLRNPNVTVRSRGVMEKCTYCVQRINAAKIRSEEEGRLVRDGEIQTACQQACPAEAIIFGNIRDKNSRVSRLKGQTRNYSLLTDLNTRPRTSYLARVRNPNPEIKSSEPQSEAGA